MVEPHYETSCAIGVPLLMRYTPQRHSSSMKGYSTSSRAGERANNVRDRPNIQGEMKTACASREHLRSKNRKLLLSQTEIN